MTSSVEKANIVQTKSQVDQRPDGRSEGRKLQANEKGYTSTELVKTFLYGLEL